MVDFKKQYLRYKVSLFSSYIEIYISILIAIGLLFLSIVTIKDLYSIIVSTFKGTAVLSVETFLSHALQLIIGIEFVKMLAKHTPGSAVEVLLFAIARKLITGHGSMLDLLIGVIAIAVLFAVRKYFTVWTQLHKITEEIVVNGGSSVMEINETFGIHIPESLGNTIAGVIANQAKARNELVKPGYELHLNNLVLQVYSMDANLIEQVKIMSSIKKGITH